MLVDSRRLQVLVPHGVCDSEYVAGGLDSVDCKRMTSAVELQTGGQSR